MNIPVIEHDLRHNFDWELVVWPSALGFTAMFRELSTGQFQEQYGCGNTVAAAIAALEIEIQKEGE